MAGKKPLTNHEIGQRYEKEVRDKLVEAGFEVWKPQWTRWGVRDILNRFDLIAYHPITGETRLVQLTAGEKSDFKRRVDKVATFKPTTLLVQCIQKDGLIYEDKYSCSR